MENEFHKQRNGKAFCKCSVLLEFAASDDVDGFKRVVEEMGLDMDEPSFWYGRSIGSKKMGFEERTPLMIAALFGSTKVLNYLLRTGTVDVNQTSGSDKVTALHCATAGGSHSSIETAKLLLSSSAISDCVDSNGYKPADVIAPAFNSTGNSRRKAVEMLLRGNNNPLEEEEEEEEEKKVLLLHSSKEGSDKKEYPVDISLPDINEGIYGSDEFRMYSFKVKPCSRAYSHDWTECPFVHPGENARRRDPKKFPYSCVPCPEFRKGSCQKGDSCEYAHGVFESWLHPAQYRTRLCKDETGCTRKVCFFAHRPEELRPVYASTGSALPSPRSNSVSAADMAIPTSSALNPSTSTPPMSPLASATSSPKNVGLWTPPALQLPGSRLKSALSARDFNLEMELMDEISRLSSPNCWSGKDFCREALDSSSTMSQMQGISLNSPTGLSIRQNMNQLRASYPSTNALLSSSPSWNPSSFGFDSSAAVAAAVMNSRSAGFAKRSHSFIDRAAVNNIPGQNMLSSNHLSDWGSPNGKLDWGVQGDELNKLKKSASFGIRNNMNVGKLVVEEPDVSWVNSLVKDVPSENSGRFGAYERLPPWLEQMYRDEDRIVA